MSPFVILQVHHILWNFCSIILLHDMADIHAINKSIKINFPSMPQQCADAAVEFENISHNGDIKICVGVVDGYLLAIVTRSKHFAKKSKIIFQGTTKSMALASRHLAMLTAASHLWGLVALA